MKQRKWWRWWWSFPRMKKRNTNWVLQQPSPPPGKGETSSVRTQDLETVFSPTNTEDLFPRGRYRATCVQKLNQILSASLQLVLLINLLVLTVFLLWLCCNLALQLGRFLQDNLFSIPW